jgi:hypothetical protein
VRRSAEDRGIAFVGCPRRRRRALAGVEPARRTASLVTRAADLRTRLADATLAMSGKYVGSPFTTRRFSGPTNPRPGTRRRGRPPAADVAPAGQDQPRACPRQQVKGSGSGSALAMSGHCIMRQIARCLFFVLTLAGAAPAQGQPDVRATLLGSRTYVVETVRGTLHLRLQTAPDGHLTGDVTWNGRPCGDALSGSATGARLSFSAGGCSGVLAYDGATLTGTVTTPTGTAQVSFLP